MRVCYVEYIVAGGRLVAAAVWQMGRETPSRQQRSAGMEPGPLVALTVTHLTQQACPPGSSCKPEPRTKCLAVVKTDQLILETSTGLYRSCAALAIYCCEGLVWLILYWFGPTLLALVEFGNLVCLIEFGLVVQQTNKQIIII